MKRLIYKNPDGSLRIVIPVNLTKSLKEIRADAEAKDPAMAQCTYVGEVEESDIPQTREFRSCWRLNGSKVRVDPALETEERWKRVRVQRDKLLAESDGNMLRAKDLNQKVSEWESYRQALRDIPTQSDPKTIVWPTRPS